MNISVFEMPLDFGASRHGSDMGPSAIRLAGLREKIESLGLNINNYSNLVDIKPQEYEASGDPKAKYLEPITKVCRTLANEVYKTAKNGDFPLMLGGDHSIALGSLAGISRFAKENNKRLGVLYVDAHGDFNTPETTPTGNIHGECLSASCGFGKKELTDLYFEGVKVSPKDVCFVGTRDLDAGERELMKKAGVTVFSMSDIERHGFPAIVKKIIVFFKTHADIIHVSFDMDVLDPMFAPGTGIPLPAGLTNREALLLMEEMAETKLVKSAEFVEVNPVLDVRNQTATLAVSLITRLLGEKIY